MAAAAEPAAATRLRASPSPAQPITRTQVGEARALQQAPLLGRHPRLLQQRRQAGAHVWHR